MCLAKTKLEQNVKKKSFSDLPTIKFWQGRQETRLYFVVAYIHMSPYGEEYFKISLYKNSAKMFCYCCLAIF